MLHFASQLRSEQESTPSLRAAHYRRRHKAARLDAPSPSPSPSPPPSSRFQSHTPTSSAPPGIGLLRVAGLLPEEDDQVPPPPFPHAPAKQPCAHLGRAKARQDLAQLPSPLYVAHAASDSPAADPHGAALALKKTHLHLLSTLMHKCLLDGDYERAGRAWGIILRTQTAGGRPVDPRNNGRWGIGAELLLYRRPPSAQATQEPDPSTPTADSLFTPHGFELAREYYERLIVQHPYRRYRPAVADERTFYPAMFSLWIFQVCEQSRLARANLHAPAARGTRTSRSPNADSVLGHETDLEAKEEAIRVEELARATEIAERLDHLIISPPFDKQVSLLQLRGHVALWMSDLVIENTSFDNDWDMDSSREDNEHSHSSLEKEQLTRLADRQRELQKARDLFTRAKSTSTRGLAGTLSSIDIRLREMDRQQKQSGSLGDESNSHLTF